MVREDRHRAYEKDSLNEVQIYRDVRVVEDRRRVEGKHPKVRILHAGSANGNDGRAEEIPQSFVRGRRDQNRASSPGGASGLRRKRSQCAQSISRGWSVYSASSRRAITACVDLLRQFHTWIVSLSAVSHCELGDASRMKASRSRNRADSDGQAQS